jgi:hypothetical protein
MHRTDLTWSLNVSSKCCDGPLPETFFLYFSAVLLGETFFIHWFMDPPTVNIQKVKNKKNLDVNNFTILVNFS